VDRKREKEKDIEGSSRKRGGFGFSALSRTVKGILLVYFKRSVHMPIKLNLAGNKQCPTEKVQTNKNT
jgi:hypothetical protein